MNGLANCQGGLSVVNRRMIVDFAARHRLPAVYQATLFAEAGGLMAWAPDPEEQYRVAAHYVDQSLKGANPGDLPIRYPSGYFLTINAGAARRSGWFFRRRSSCRQTACCLNRRLVVGLPKKIEDLRQLGALRDRQRFRRW
jgi:ABC-type uncharacterized transport system substrate-binding protein